MTHKQKNRCIWANNVPDFYVAYHDQEWGKPVHDDQHLFEMLILEGAQAGLSWETILKRRDGYRKVFKNFDLKKVSKLTDEQLDKILKDDRIIRNRLKVYATRKNAIAFLAIQKEFGSFDKYLWGFVGHKPKTNIKKTTRTLPTVTKESEALSKDLKKRGMTFVGPTIMLAYMQAVGLYNDHMVDCFKYKK